MTDIVKFSVLVDRPEHRVTVEVPVEFLRDHSADDLVDLLDRSVGGVVVRAEEIAVEARTDIYAKAHIE